METVMSRGPGRVEQIIEAAFNAEPDNAFSVEDLCDRVYPNQPAEKKHRVSVLRAAKNIAKRRSEIDTITGENLGGTLVFYDQYRVMSYAMARLKTDRLNRYQSNDKRDTWTLSRSWAKSTPYGDPGKGMVWRIKKRRYNEEHLRARLSEEGPDHQHIIPGGAWWRHTEIRKAKRDGDVETVKRLKAEGEAALAAIMQQFPRNGVSVSKIDNDAIMETLNVLTESPEMRNAPSGH